MSCTNCSTNGTGTGIYNFTINQGANVLFGLEYLDSTESPIDLTDYSARMQVRSAYADEAKSTLYFTVSSSVDTDGSVLDMGGLYGTAPKTSGSIGVKISAEKTLLLKDDEAIYDIELYSGSYVTRLLEGNIIVRKEVTR